MFSAYLPARFYPPDYGGTVAEDFDVPEYTCDKCGAPSVRGTQSLYCSPCGIADEQAFRAASTDAEEIQFSLEEEQRYREAASA